MLLVTDAMNFGLTEINHKFRSESSVYRTSHLRR
ncbi:unnamed protein product [Acanthoscelides obtectus]|uniref:Uncharacterized protein n=1 Tax=Acanthoscelides obtectus TaxID=200917 RepID=A0A9P0NW83_ACAOB|nr:unnamed protein product [Acanthoscelides obtectus]CAK1679293.1 hypothetical protein AOBTE_LOCUS32203 [Acanthoscelides obtectus]